MSYKITSLGKSKEITSKYGPLTVYDVEFEGVGWVEITQKPDSPAPTIGQTLDGNVEDTQYGKRFKKAQQGGGGFGGGGGRADSPETRRSIQSQTALKEARQAVFEYHSLKSDDELKDLDFYLNEIITTHKKFEGLLGNQSPQTTVTQPAAPEKTMSSGVELPPIDSYTDMDPFK